MNGFLHHTNCPNCGSSDALAIYEDGHKWCFSCHHYVPSTINNLDKLKKHFEERNINKCIKNNELPNDATSNIPREPLTWLKGYGVTNDEIISNNLMWSSSREMLIFPFFGDSKDVLLCWQGRFFPKRKPKVYTSGTCDNHLLLHHSSSVNERGRVCIVEDSISAIKVARVCDSSELLGSHLSMHKAISLSREYLHLTLWLDNDKLKEMIKFVEKFKPLFDKIDYIHTEKDPKEYSTEEIKEFLNA